MGERSQRPLSAAQGTTAGLPINKLIKNTTYLTASFLSFQNLLKQLSGPALRASEPRNIIFYRQTARVALWPPLLYTLKWWDG
jgi:hypothetical protein